MTEFRLLFLLLASIANIAAFAGDLEDAIRDANSAAVSAALEHGADPNAKTDSGAPLLVLAASRNLTDIVADLLRAGADVNATTTSNESALMYASASNNAELARRLLDAGAHVDLRDSQGDPAVNWGAYYGSLEYINVLLEAEADTSLRGHGNAYEIALRRGHEDIIRRLAEYTGKDSGQATDTHDSLGRPLIHIAAKSGDLKLIESYLDAGVNVDAEDEIGFTALMHASRDGQLASVQLLLEHGADVNHTATKHGLRLTALHVAAITNQTDIMTELINHGALLDVQGVIGSTPFGWSVLEGSKEAAILLLNAGANWRIGPDDGPNLLELVDTQGWRDAKELMERSGD